MFVEEIHGVGYVAYLSSNISKINSYTTTFYQWCFTCWPMGK